MRKQDRICGQRYAYAVDPGVLTCACICIPEIILEAERLSADDARSQERTG